MEVDLTPGAHNDADQGARRHEGDTASYGPQSRWLDDGKRLHLQHGPIDLIIEAMGSHNETQAAYSQATHHFQTLLQELVDELPALRCEYNQDHRFTGATAQRMHEAVAPFNRRFITPMAAVAGSVADAELSAMLNHRELRRAYVNNGGDIALYLSAAETFRLAIVARPDTRRILGYIDLHSQDGVGGVATSGWPGRSHSLGIADSVTVLATSAAVADAAATTIANAVDLPESDRVHREAACVLSPDSDLGDRRVTVDVEPLSGHDIHQALHAGSDCAESLIRQHVIVAACIHLQNHSRLLGEPFQSLSPA